MKARKGKAGKREKSKAVRDIPRSHLIRFPDEQDLERAFEAFLRVPFARVTFPGMIMGVTGQHIRALEEEGIPFEYVSQAPDGEEDPTD